MRFERDYSGRGVLSMKAGNYAAAIDNYRRAIKFNSRCVSAFNARVDADNAADEYGNPSRI